MNLAAFRLFCFMLFAAQMLEGLVYWGYAGIIIYMILTGCGLPMPEEVAIIAGGTLAAGGQLDPWLTLGSLLIGAILGDCVMYAIGHHFGRRIMKANRLGAAFLTPEREQRVEKLLSRHGAKVLFFARFLVGIRGPIYITAGILKMPFRKFLLADLVCATIVVSLFFAATYFYGQKIIRVIHDGEGVFTLVVITALVIAGIALLWYQLHYKKKLPGLGTLEIDANAATEGNDPPAQETANLNGENAGKVVSNQREAPNESSANSLGEVPRAQSVGESTPGSHVRHPN